MNDMLYEQLTEEQKVAELHARDKEIHDLRNRLFSALAEICLAARPAKGNEEDAQPPALEEEK